MTESRLGAAALGTAAFFVVEPGTVVGLAPYLISGWRVEYRLPGLLRLFGVTMIAVGLLSVLESFTRFVVHGHGTPAPVAPPKQLVVSGQYRYGRNPMYVALVAIVLGQAVFHLRAVTYEEPRLTGLFGAEFGAYRRAVPRWIPRVAPWRGSPTRIAQEASDRRTRGGN
jgi:protein-S-isoprenylcysteine O-methyltransferase Ste14